MGEEFYAIIKLVSGEEIFSLVCVDENDGDPIIVLQNPVIMKASISSSGASLVKVRPWVELSDEDFFMIKLDKIITMTETKNKKLIQVYEYYLNNDTTDLEDPISGRVKITEDMGYVNSVEKERKRLENIFKDLKES